MLQVDPTTLIKRQVFDNFLPQDDFEWISKIAMTPNEDRQVLYQLQSTVAEIDDIEEGMPHWNWMGISMIYSEDCVVHPFFTEIKEQVLPVIKEKVYDYKSLVRIKSNFYPWTHEIKHHRYHTDLNWDNVAAVLSLNTCDGYTEFEYDTPYLKQKRIQSVANRLVVFDGQHSHRSTTTTTNYGRYNINFNFL